MAPSGWSDGQDQAAGLSLTHPVPPNYRGPADPGRDRVLCVRCGDPIHRLADNTTRLVGLNPAWLDSLEAIDPQAINALRAYLHQLAILWWHTHRATDGAAAGRGQADLRTYQRGGDPTAARISDGQATQCDDCPYEQPCDLGTCMHAGTQRTSPTWQVPPQLADQAAEGHAASEYLRRCRREAQRIRDAQTRLQRENAELDLARSPNLEREQRRGLRDGNGRLVS